MRGDEDEEQAEEAMGEDFWKEFRKVVAEELEKQNVVPKEKAEKKPEEGEENRPIRR